MICAEVEPGAVTKTVLAIRTIVGLLESTDDGVNVVDGELEGEFMSELEPEVAEAKGSPSR